MKKLDKVTFDNNMFDLYNTKYDYLFSNIIKSRGVGYHLIERVKDIHKSNNKVFSIVEGTKPYNVSIEFDNDNIKDVHCECIYHKDTDKYCKHVYALLLSLKMIYEKEKLIRIYKINYEKICAIKKEINKEINDNKKYLYSLTISWCINLESFYDKYLKELDDKYNRNTEQSLISAVKDSYYHLNHIIEDYNHLIDEIEEGKKELKRKEEEEKEKKEETIDEGYTYVFDDSFIYDKFDKISNEINELEKNIEELEKAKKENEKKIKKTLFFGFLYKLFNNSKSKNDTTLMSWEEDLVKKGEYEPFHFEEENMEEDDYYYEDD